MTEQDTNQGIPEPEGEAGIIDTEYMIGQDNVEGQVGPFGFDVHNPVNGGAKSGHVAAQNQATSGLCATGA